MKERLVNFLRNYGILIAFVAISVAFRLIPHLPNAAPVGALALFAGTYFARRWSWIVPLSAMLITDYFIGFYDVRIMIAVYGSFIVYFLIGMLVKKNTNPVSVAIGSLLGSISFFAVTNFAVWMFSGMYPFTVFGLAWSYAMALPFFKNTLVGDITYSAVFFGIYALLSQYQTSLKTKAPLLREVANSISR